MKIASWNLEGRLSDLACGSRGTPKRIVVAIRALDADVLVHPEAFGTDPLPAPEIEDALRAMGYTSVSAAYDDAPARDGEAVVPNPHFRLMSRLPIVSHESIRPGGIRNMVSAVVRDTDGTELRVIGIHLEDRSEQLRMKQVAELVEYINGSDMPTVMMGDFNAMPPGTLRSRVVHSRPFRGLARLAPSAHMRYTMSRLSEMAAGTTIGALLSGTRLRNTDPRFRPTTTPKMRRMEMLPSVRLAKIDWILVSPGIAYRNFAVSRDLGSDHRALGLEVSLGPPAKTV